MKPRAHTFIAFLLLGGALNVLVAWACEVTTVTECVDLSDQAARTRRPFSVEGTWQQSSTVQEARGLGRTTVWYLRGPGLGDVCVHQAGWPMRSMQYQYDEVPPSSRARVASANFLAAINTAPHAWLPKALLVRPLPLRPMPLGFALNSVVWGTVLLLPFGGSVEFIRRRRRARKGLCPACGYPIGVSTLCTECGHVLRRSAG